MKTRGKKSMNEFDYDPASIIFPKNASSTNPKISERMLGTGQSMKRSLTQLAGAQLRRRTAGLAKLPVMAATLREGSSFTQFNKNVGGRVNRIAPL